MTLEGKVALVTGSAKRTGKALALTLAQNGADVVIHYKTSKDEAEHTVAQIQALGKKSYCVQADITLHQQAQSLVDTVIAKSGQLDILVNNVGLYQEKSVKYITSQEWKTTIDGTLNCTYYMCNYALTYMTRQRYGRIVNVVDTEADHTCAFPQRTAYMIGKAGILSLTKALAHEFGKNDITINCISPGTIENSVTKPDLADIPKGRYATTDDIANALLFLMSEQSNYITGANIKVNGGWRM